MLHLVRCGVGVISHPFWGLDVGEGDLPPIVWVRRGYGGDVPPKVGVRRGG